MKETWRHVWGFSGYAISDQGRVVNREDKSEIVQKSALDGCTTVVLIANNGTPMVKKVCRLVIDSFDWASEGYTPIYHLDGDKKNNAFDNLRRRTLDTEILNRYSADNKYLSQEDVDRANVVQDAKPLTPPKPKNAGRQPRGIQDQRRVRVIETGEEYNSKADLSRALGLDASTVSAMLRQRSRSKTHHGYTFEYIDDIKPYVRIIQTGEVYFNVLELCRAFDLDPSNVRKMLAGTSTQKTYRKMSFEFVDRDDESIKNVTILRFYDRPEDLPQKSYKGVIRPVRIIQTGQVFPNQKEAARAIGGKQAMISRCLLGERKSHMGYRFEYADAG